MFRSLILTAVLLAPAAFAASVQDNNDLHHGLNNRENAEQRSCTDWIDRQDHFGWGGCGHAHGGHGNNSNHR